jgi:hypothetical protein
MVTGKCNAFQENVSMMVMKPPPDTPEFTRFTEALKTMLKVSKTEMQRRIEEDKRTRTAERQAK